MSRAEDRDLAHEADMRRRARQQTACETDEEALEAIERNAEGTYDYDEPTDEEKAEYWASQEDANWLSPSEYEASQA